MKYASLVEDRGISVARDVFITSIWVAQPHQEEFQPSCPSWSLIYRRILSPHLRRYTPQWYAYQLERAPNTRGTWFIPAMDILLGLLLFPRRTRTPAVMAITAFFGLGLGLRVVAGRDFTGDAVLLVLALLTLSTTW
ncbi:hypothetical protein C8F04DRAFT_290740 [Mycena alexandri]|uniref:Uncharacterized protein n=1 Tax=Mycena alexandri TaxID=1745969 RepID=A0AAD6S5F4_9AGAR|nr:hypothetical protein C8F04DRAFT_290740 [Mycena alexandri]